MAYPGQKGKKMQAWETLFAFAAAFAVGVPFSGANAAETLLTGKVVETQGHANMACRMLGVKQEGTGVLHWFRLPNTGSDNSMLAVAMSAQAAGLTVVVGYHPGMTSGCGTEPAVTYIAMRSPG